MEEWMIYDIIWYDMRLKGSGWKSGENEMNMRSMKIVRKWDDENQFLTCTPYLSYIVWNDYDYSMMIITMMYPNDMYIWATETVNICII